MKSRCMVGEWAVDEGLLMFVNANTAYTPVGTHDGVVFKFKDGVPKHGELVLVSKHLDTCVRPGTYRPSVRRMIRVRRCNHDLREIFPIRLAVGVPAAGWNLNHGYTLYLDKPAFPNCIQELCSVHEIQ